MNAPEKRRHAFMTKLAEQHINDVYELLGDFGGKMNLPTKNMDLYMEYMDMWKILEDDPTIKISERTFYGSEEIVVVERISP